MKFLLSSLVTDETIVLHRAQITIEEVIGDIASLMRASLLFEAEMDAAVNARIVNVVADLLPVGVVEDHARQPGTGQGNGEVLLAEGPLDHGACRSR